jgi:hypothetical protein
MPRLWIGNFDFEWSLSQHAGKPPRALAQISAELCYTWLALAEPDDVILSPAAAEPDFPSHLQQQIPWSLPRFVATLNAAPRHLVPAPWGWTAQVTAVCAQAGFSLPPHPDPEAVRRVNSREFSLRIEQHLGCGLTGAAWLTTLGEVRDAVLALGQNAAPASSQSERTTERADDSPRWLLKAAWSNSARERLLGGHSDLSAAEQTWVESRIARDGGIACEPWVEIVDEAGVQWEIPQTGAARLIGVAPLLTDRFGRYCGSVFHLPAQADEWTAAIDATRFAAEQAQSQGYFGPLGIDVCRYRAADGSTRLRPLQDINARWTMGRLSLGWRRLTTGHQTGLWRHGRPERGLRGWVATHGSPARVIPTSPCELNGVPARLQHRIELYERIQ